MSQTIPCIIMRGGTSRGPYLQISDLPQDRDACADVLMKIMGSGHELQLDGIGGGNSLTSKVAMVGKSTHPDADVDYLFAQVAITEKSVDFSPNCGNMLAGVAPYAIETGLFPASEGKTTVRIHNLNTGKIIHSTVQTPNGKVNYAGDTIISGANFPSAPIELTFYNVEGAKTGHLLPTGNVSDIIESIEVTCIDAATPVILIQASDLGKTGYETPAELDSDVEFMARLEVIRLQAGKLMGMGDVSKSVIPKPILLSPARFDGAINARYFVPHKCHKALAVTGSIAIVTACCRPGTVAAKLIGNKGSEPFFTLEHPSGKIELSVQRKEDDPSALNSVSVIRTAKKIMSGTVYLN
ncbi:4-oxalomesaconate tautomerase [Marinomonas sp. CT5]|uniref:4-oxalomesaconate tautomerase n=1 Tax=Marinomonas sp. CT5 TaxID=2066133 RepID=UPI00180AB68B|nr:4-oxalomesaconate tautomerase [Marinomonas sp. CT5]NVK73088.1 4-oxalomesaconate tautomerase [Oceanospirillaceae bacterium]QUX95614.1 4-oxalomesaconate tautomerase [Marinomonas sp. CT5]